MIIFDILLNVDFLIHELITSTALNALLKSTIVIKESKISVHVDINLFTNGYSYCANIALSVYKSTFSIF